MRGPKREPTLADLFITHADNRNILQIPKGGEKYNRALRRKVQIAEKFVFDTAASERVGTVLRDVPELLVEQIQFARPPFDLCWIEYDADIIFEMLNPNKGDIYDRTRDKRVGILIDHNRITVLTETYARQLSYFPFVYYLNTEWKLEDQLVFCDLMRISRIGIDVWLWGSVAAKFMNEGKNDYLRVLRDTNMVELMRQEQYDEPLSIATAEHIFRATTGDFKNHVAMLLMLNQPKVTLYAKVPTTRGWVGNKPRPFMKHNTVRVALDPVPAIRKLSEGPGPGDLRRRHRVRGHYCHNEAARRAIFHHTCIHDWQPTNKRWEPIKTEVGDEPENWICASCTGRRWWREEHVRGDASKGYVDHDYEVTH